jgi:hypothetical protein
MMELERRHQEVLQERDGLMGKLQKGEEAWQQQAGIAKWSCEHILSLHRALDKHTELNKEDIRAITNASWTPVTPTTLPIKECQYLIVWVGLETVIAMGWENDKKMWVDRWGASWEWYRATHWSPMPINPFKI